MRTVSRFIPHCLIAASFAMALSACGQNEMSGAKVAAPQTEAPMEALGAVAMSRDAAPDSYASGGEKADAAPQQAGASNSSAPDTPAGPVLLAYSYAMGVEAPLKAVPSLAKAHEQACIAAGPQICQVLGSSNQSYGEDSLSATLRLRAEPKWLAKFRAQIETDAKGAHGQVRSNTVTSEDLTRAIVDTSAQLNAQKTLRTRLQALLASRPGKLSDLLDVERELARVQGQIDSQESELAVMRQRVAMSTLDINYQSETLAVASGAFEPLVQAFKSIAGNIIAGLAAMVTIISVLLPWLIVLIPAFYYGGRAWKRRKARKALDKVKAEASSGSAAG